MADTKLKDDLAKKVEPVEGAEESIVALVLSVADRIDTHGASSAVPMTGYVESLRDGSDDVTNAIMANIPDRK